MRPSSSAVRPRRLRLAAWPGAVSRCQGAGYFPVALRLRDGRIAVVLRGGAGLLPDDTGPDWPLRITYLPDLRGRIEKDTGVRIPGVRLWQGGSELPPHQYRILLGELAAVQDGVRPGRHYCPHPAEAVVARLGVGREDLTPVPELLTGAPGCWVNPAHADAARAAGFELWEDPLRFVVAHLEATLRTNLAGFLDLQEAERLLGGWARGEEGAVLIGESLSTAGDRLRLARLLRALVAEHVPVTRPVPILEAFRRADRADDGRAALRAARMALRDLLPGNRPGVQHLPLPEATEQRVAAGVRGDARRAFLALPREDVQAALAQVRALVATAARPAVLITRRADLRPLVRRLVEVEFPQLMVLSEEEALPP